MVLIIALLGVVAVAVGLVLLWSGHPFLKYVGVAVIVAGLIYTLGMAPLFGWTYS